MGEIDHGSGRAEKTIETETEAETKEGSENHQTLKFTSPLITPFTFP
jgi:hypothetical protein